MANGNGDAQRLERLEASIRGEVAAADAATEQFTLQKLADFFVAHGEAKRELTDEYAKRMLDMLRRELAYVEQFVGKAK